jgi:hypothetical protein
LIGMYTRINLIDVEDVSHCLSPSLVALLSSNQHCNDYNSLILYVKWVRVQFLVDQAVKLQSLCVRTNTLMDSVA